MIMKYFPEPDTAAPVKNSAFYDLEKLESFRFRCTIESDRLRQLVLFAMKPWEARLSDQAITLLIDA
jgi:hypothetical protein